MKIEFTETHNGNFYKCKANGVQINRKEFEELTGIDPYITGGFRLSKLLYDWAKDKDVEISYFDMDIS